ncbi:MAG: dihydrolipoamide acetyltransferase family protein [Anaerolineae bacterium]|nr:2-oxo acid dehydrogenase subunit E2 [Anaerolineae bacterium]MDW8098809.1 dihydrolipoamide acetyltransferase family protein [Anaerolineae bacterium]
MAELILMPKLGFDMAEGTLIEWVKKAGDPVAENEVIAIIETDKASVEVPSFRSGVLRALLVEEGTVVPVGQPIAVIGAADEKIDLAALGVEKAVPEEEREAAAIAVAVAPVSEPSPPAEAGRRAISPVARRMAEELGIDLNRIRGSGPGGRIIKRDIEEHLKQLEQAPRPAPPPPIPIPSAAPAEEGYQVEPLSPMRQTIGRRMVESKQQAPHFYITIEVDMEAAMALREQLNALLPEGEKISVNDLVIKAAAIALRQFPRLNASFAGNEIHIHHQINIGIAVAREAGLVTTVVRDCDKKSLSQIAREARELIGRAREGKMRAEDMVGGTFTVSNLGMFGVEDFVAIINPPQAAILAVGAVRRVPVVNDQDQLRVGTRMKATLSADHRVTDGAEAARFLQAFKAALEQPMRLVL